ncbi:MAG: hypothetical protein OEY49_05860 [Candidatus Heimdallarchaeota archaeon]|nr:hypothetical protein [Candidatus Heimdallarchaeota archaeon]
MINSQFHANIGIIAHGDADGICSAAIIKSKFPGAYVVFSIPSQLHKSIKEIQRILQTIDTLYIVDIAINTKNQHFILERLKKSIKLFKIIYIDNHILPWNVEYMQKEVINIDINDYVTTYIQKPEWSSSALTYATLYGDSFQSIIAHRNMALLAGYGAIADYAKKCSLLKLIIDTWDETSIYYQAFLLKQASRLIKSDDLKRSIADKLSVGILPSEMFEVVEAARESSRETDVAVKYIMDNAEKYDNLGVIIECPVGSMGHNAYVSATLTQSPIGVAITRKGGNAVFIIRKQHEVAIHLGELATVVSRELNCDGGGEYSTAGIISDDNMIIPVLDMMNRYLNKINV